MNISEAVEVLERAAVAIYLGTGPFDPGPFAALHTAAREEHFEYGDPRRMFTDAGAYLMARAGRKPTGSHAHQAVTHLLSSVLFRVAQSASALRVADGDLCPCVVVRLWHPALAAARAVLGVTESEGCAAHEEAMR